MGKYVKIGKFIATVWQKDRNYHWRPAREGDVDNTGRQLDTYRGIAFVKLSECPVVREEMGCTVHDQYKGEQYTTGYYEDSDQKMYKQPRQSGWRTIYFRGGIKHSASERKVDSDYWTQACYTVQDGYVHRRTFYMHPLDAHHETITNFSPDMDVELKEAWKRYFLLERLVNDGEWYGRYSPASLVALHEMGYVHKSTDDEGDEIWIPDEDAHHFIEYVQDSIMQEWSKYSDV